MAEMIGSLINGAYCVLGELKGSTRPGLWLAHSLVTGELVTLGVPAADGGLPTAEELRREGEIFGDISSRYVQAVVDWSNEDVFVAWEYVAAWTLSTALRTAPPPSMVAVLRLMSDLAQGLAMVHGRGAVYRGLHPGRVIVRRDGTAQLTTTPESVLAKRGRLVEIGPPRETPVRYLAPEQIEGSASASSDLYSLAIVAFELLTGHLSYSRSDPVSLAIEILNTSPPPPSTHRPDVPAEVDDLFAHCLARRPDDRPRNAVSLVAYINKLVVNYEDTDVEPLARRLGLHPVAHPLLASDNDRLALFRAVSSPASAADLGGSGTMSTPAAEPTMSRQAFQTAPPDERGDGRRPVAEPWGEPETGAEQEQEQEQDQDQDQDQEQGGAFLVAANGTEFRLTPPSMTIGRRGSNGACPEIDLGELDAEMVVSREHAAVNYRHGGWHVLELRARNGSWLNDERLTPGVEIRLQSGDRLRLANADLTFDDRDDRPTGRDEVAMAHPFDAPEIVSPAPGASEWPAAEDVQVTPGAATDVVSLAGQGLRQER